MRSLLKGREAKRIEFEEEEKKKKGYVETMAQVKNQIVYTICATVLFGIPNYLTMPKKFTSTIFSPNSH